MMALKQTDILILLLCSLILSGFEVYALDYDYSFTHECLVTPLKAQYSGGVVVNPELNDGLNGWSRFGGSKIETRVNLEDGNKFIVALNRKRASDSLSQTFHLEKDKLYIVSAWVQLSRGNAEVSVILKTASGHYKRAGSTIARSGCWTMLKGGFDVHVSGPAPLYFLSNNAAVEIWADSISLQPFSHEEWKSHHHQSIEKMRKRKLKIQAVDPSGQALANATVHIRQKNLAFPLGCALSPHILNNKPYQAWFTSRFKMTVFENEMKWHINEPVPGKEDYSLADAMLRFAKKHNIRVRGHNIVWENPVWLPSWVRSLSPTQLSAAVNRRINSIVRRYAETNVRKGGEIFSYAGQLIHWDGDNEGMHFSFLTDKLGKNASAHFYEKAHKIDSKPLLFLNEIDTIERPKILLASPAKYLKKIKEMRALGYKGPLGIGLEGHFDVPDVAYMRAAVDALASAKLPIWLTEVDVSSSPRVNAHQVGVYLEKILREAHAHPAIKGIMIWSPWQPQGCYKMCLTNNNFENLPAGDVVDKMLREWRHHGGLSGITDAIGHFETSLFHGDYQVKVSHPAIQNGSLLAASLKATSAIGSPKRLLLKLSA